MKEFRVIILIIFLISTGVFTAKSSEQQEFSIETGSDANEASYMSGKYESSYEPAMPLLNSSDQTYYQEDAVGRNNSRFFSIINPSNSEERAKMETENNSDNYTLDEDEEEEEEEAYHEAAFTRSDAIRSVSDTYLQQREDQTCPDQKRSNNFPGR